MCQNQKCVKIKSCQNKKCPKIKSVPKSKVAQNQRCPKIKNVPNSKVSQNQKCSKIKSVPKSKVNHMCPEIKCVQNHKGIFFSSTNQVSTNVQNLKLKDLNCTKSKLSKIKCV